MDGHPLMEKYILVMTSFINQDTVGQQPPFQNPTILRQFINHTNGKLIFFEVIILLCINFII
jgi:hypothetical protein